MGVMFKVLSALLFSALLLSPATPLQAQPGPTEPHPDTSPPKVLKHIRGTGGIELPTEQELQARLAPDPEQVAALAALTRERDAREAAQLRAAQEEAAKKETVSEK